MRLPWDRPDESLRHLGRKGLLKIDCDIAVVWELCAPTHRLLLEPKRLKSHVKARSVLSSSGWQGCGHCWIRVHPLSSLTARGLLVVDRCDC